MENTTPQPRWVPLLKPGHTIGLCSPAAPSSREAIEKAVHALEARSYHVVVAENAGEKEEGDFGYLAGSDQSRAADLNHLFADPDVDLILALRGGYGSMRLLDKLEYDTIQQNPKPLVGYSDITALSLALAARAKIISFSGPMATAGDGFGEETFDPFTERNFFAAVGAGGFPRLLSDESTWKIHRAPAQTISGRLYPVCLTLLLSLLQTPYLPDLNGAILVIEDIHEPLYKVDRYLTQLRLAGILDKVAGVLIGSFNGTTADEDTTLLAQVPHLVCAFTPPSVAVVSGVSYGHISRRLTLPVGAETTIDLTAQTFMFPGDQ